MGGLERRTKGTETEGAVGSVRATTYFEMHASCGRGIQSVSEGAAPSKVSFSTKLMLAGLECFVGPNPAPV